MKGYVGITTAWLELWQVWRSCSPVSVTGNSWGAYSPHHLAFAFPLAQIINTKSKIIKFQQLQKEKHMNRISQLKWDQIKKTKLKIKCFHLDMTFSWPRWGDTMECRQHHVSIYDVIPNQMSISDCKKIWVACLTKEQKEEKEIKIQTKTMYKNTKKRILWCQDSFSLLQCFLLLIRLSMCHCTALQEWCLRWLDIDSGPQCGIPTHPSPASYWYIVIISSFSIFALIFFTLLQVSPCSNASFSFSMFRLENMVDNILKWIWLLLHFYGFCD